MVNHVHFKRHLRVVKVVDIPSKRSALLLSTALDLRTMTLYPHGSPIFKAVEKKRCTAV